MIRRIIVELWVLYKIKIGIRNEFDRVLVSVIFISLKKIISKRFELESLLNIQNKPHTSYYSFISLENGR